jgi:hypothetical protein
MMAEAKAQVGRTQNRTWAVTSFFPTHPEVCKTFIRRFDPAPRLQPFFNNFQ